jgi:hypothetical protein
MYSFVTHNHQTVTFNWQKFISWVETGEAHELNKNNAGG